MLARNRGAAALVVGVMLGAAATGCSPSAHGTGGSGANVQQVASADSGQAVVDQLAKRLATAEQRLADDLAPLGGLSEFGPYLTAVSRADAGTRTSLASARARLAALDCDGLARSLATLRSANGRLDGAVGTLNSRIAQVTVSTSKILTDRDAVLDAQASLEAALKAHPSAWVGQDGAPLQDMLTAIARWQSSLADTVATARGTAATTRSRVADVSAASAKLTTACRSTSTQARKPPPVDRGNGTAGTVVVQPVVRPVAPRPVPTTPAHTHTTPPPSPKPSPSASPTEAQTPSPSPTEEPTSSPSPTEEPTQEPSPTEQPTPDPTPDPTPTEYPTEEPTPTPTQQVEDPSASPSEVIEP